MFLLLNGCVVISINNVSKYGSKIRANEMFQSNKKRLEKNTPQSYHSNLCSQELLLLLLQHSSAGTYHAAAGHTLFLSLRSLEFSTLDQFRWTSACAPPLLLLAHLRSVCLDDTANQRKEGEKEKEGRGKINSKFEIYFKVYGRCKGLNYGAKKNKQSTQHWPQEITARLIRPLEQQQIHPVAGTSQCASTAFSG